MAVRVQLPPGARIDFITPYKSKIYEAFLFLEDEVGGVLSTGNNATLFHSTCFATIKLFYNLLVL